MRRASFGFFASAMNHLRRRPAPLIFAPERTESTRRLHRFVRPRARRCKAGGGPPIREDRTRASREPDAEGGAPRLPSAQLAPTAGH